MNNELVTVLNPPYTLNFMIYIQNIYLNQRDSEGDLKFPYYNKPLAFHPNFETQFHQLWQQLVEKIADSAFNEMELFYEQKDLFKERLFNDEEAYEQLHISFHTWWASLAGRYSIERATDSPMETIYYKLTRLLKKANIEPLKSLHVHVIYDRCVFEKQQEHRFYAIYSIEDFMRYNKEIALKLVNCFR